MALNYFNYDDRPSRVWHDHCQRSGVGLSKFSSFTASCKQLCSKMAVRIEMLFRIYVLIDPRDIELNVGLDHLDPLYYT